MSTWFRLALRQLRNHRRFSIFFCLNLALGLSGFIVLDAFKTSLQSELDEGSKGILGADLTVQVRNREFTDAEVSRLLELMPDGSQAAHSYSLFTMGATDRGSRLIRLIGVTDLYPLYGSLTLRTKGEIQRQTQKDLIKQPYAWVYPELAVQLQLSAGSKLKIGNRVFTVTDIVDQDTSGTASAFNFAPKVFVSDAMIPQLGLLAPGSRFREAYYFRLPPEQDLAAVAKLLSDEFKQQRDIRVRTHTNASENLARSMTYLTDYLGLMALVALFLSALGSAYLFRSFILSKRKEIATLMSLGATGRQSRNIYILQLTILGGCAALLSLGLAVLVFPFVPTLAEGLMPFVLYPKISLRVAALAMAMGTFGSVLICLPLLARIGDLSPALLFNEFSLDTSGRKLRHGLLYLPIVALYWLMAMWESQSIFVGSIFIAGFIAAAVAFGAISWALFAGLNRLQLKNLSLRIAVRQLYRNKLSTASCFLAISLGSLLICMVPQIQNLVLEEVSSPPGFELPSLFLVDIQEDQLPEVKASLAEAGTKLQFVSPLIRARLNSINGERVQVRDDEEDQPMTREEDRQRWVRSRGQNITVRERPFPSETILEGRVFSGAYNWDDEKPAEISLEMRFAERLQVTVGDRLTFDIQGVELETEVVNIRRVKWTSFQPNFFIVMQPGVLDDAPKVYIASIPDLEEDRKFELQNLLVEQFPNISIVDVASTIKRIIGILEKMGWIIQVMAIFALLAGFVVLYSIANHQAQVRRWDINLFKVLGADFPLVRRTMFWEFGILGAGAAATGAMGSFIVSFAFARIVFDSPWQLSWQVPLAATGTIVFISIATALIATQKVLMERPLAILNES